VLNLIRSDELNKASTLNIKIYDRESGADRPCSLGSPPPSQQAGSIGRLLYFCALYKESVLVLQKKKVFAVIDRRVGGRQGNHSAENLPLYMVPSKVYLANKYRTVCLLIRKGKNSYTYDLINE
jgi:hypothetical protein